MADQHACLDDEDDDHQQGPGVQVVGPFALFQQRRLEWYNWNGKSTPSLQRIAELEGAVQRQCTAQLLCGVNI